MYIVLCTFVLKFVILGVKQIFRVTILLLKKVLTAIQSILFSRKRKLFSVISCQFIMQNQVVRNYNYVYEIPTRNMQTIPSSTIKARGVCLVPRRLLAGAREGSTESAKDPGKTPFSPFSCFIPPWRALVPRVERKRCLDTRQSKGNFVIAQGALAQAKWF